MIDNALYIVPTPIGDLNDITERAKQVLAAVSLVLAEDTRNTRRLLGQLNIEARTLSAHEHNEQQRVNLVLERLANGDALALVSDAGTPLISDPGFALVRAVRVAGYRVIPLPGACAAITALSASGLATDRFTFEGFLPAKNGARRQKLAELCYETRTMVFYESPRRILDTLQAISEVFGVQRTMTLAKELTKSFEAIIDGTATELTDWFAADPQRQQGEMVLMVAGYQGPPPQQAQAEQAALLLAEHLPTKMAAGLTAEIFGLNRKPLYQYLIEQQK